jgi:methyl-accepting chemotaxis protein
MSEELAAGSQEITRAIGAVTTNAQRQVSEVKNADPVIGGWREAAARDAASAERVVAEGVQARALALRHHEDLSGAGRALAGLRQGVRLASSQALGLARRADAVEELLDLARQLVTQSEVLALNAAVEAARAGGQSQGFTAVAEETRRLADSSRAATERIGQGSEALRAEILALEATLQGLATEALRIESATQRSVVALNEIARATEAMRANAADVSASVSGARTIASRLSELRARLEADARENVVATEAVNAAASEQSAATGEIATSAASLLEASERLAALVADFKI